MHRALEALPVSTTDQVIQIDLTPVEDAEIVAVGAGRTAGRRRGAARGTVGDHLEGPEPQPVVAEAGVQPGVQHADQRVLPAVDGGEGVEPYLYLPRCHQILAGRKGR